MLEEEVNSGHAILILQAPAPCWKNEGYVISLFHNNLAGTPAADIAQCVFNEELEDDEAFKAQLREAHVVGSADGETEVAALEFFSTEGARVVMERMREPQSVKSGTTEKRRGFLSLGTEMLLVEAVVQDDSDSSDGEDNVPLQRDTVAAHEAEDPTQCPESAPVSQPHAAPPQEIESAVNKPPSPPSSVAEAPAPMPSPSAPSAHSADSETPSVFSLRVAVFEFKLLFSRRDGRTNGPPHGPHDALRKDFPLSPYMVALLLRSVELTPVALRLGSRFHVNNNSTPVFRFLVEFTTRQEMEKALRLLDDVVVDLKSPAFGAGGASTEAALQIHARRPQLERFPDWLEHVHHDRSQGLTGRLRRVSGDRNFLLIGDTPEANAAWESLAGKPFDHAWVAPPQAYAHGPHTHKPQQEPHTGSLASVSNPNPLQSGRAHEDSPLPGTGRSDDGPRAKGFSRTRMAMDVSYDHVANEGARGKRSRSNSAERPIAVGRSDPVPSVSVSATAVPSPAVAQVYSVPSLPPQQQPAFFPNPLATAAAPAVMTMMQANPFMPMGALPFAYMPPNPYMQYLQQQQLAALQSQPQTQQPSATTPGFEAQERRSVEPQGQIQSEVAGYGDGKDDQGPLPPGWRAVFSEEYKQTYYVFHDAATGQDTTTWTRPV